MLFMHNCFHVNILFTNKTYELSNPQMLKQKLDYLHENFIRAGIDFEPQHYIYSSAVY